jgi:hypothetical protein
MQKSIPAMGDAWARNGLVYLGGMALDTYHLWTNFPVAKIEDLKGKKISAPGPSANWIKQHRRGGRGRLLPTYYEDIKSGVSNGAITFSTGAWGAKLHEVAPHITKVNFGAMFAGAVVMNKRRFDKLPPEVQQVFREPAWVRQALRRSPERHRKCPAAEHGRGRRHHQRAAAAERQRWADTIPNVAQTWAPTCNPRVPRRRGAQGLHGRPEEVRRAAAARLVRQVSGREHDAPEPQRPAPAAAARAPAQDAYRQPLPFGLHRVTQGLNALGTLWIIG